MKPKDMALMALFAALTAIGAQISIPIQPVPFTFQLLFVLLAGATLGPIRGGLSQLVYLLLGVVGAPVFAGLTGGLGILLGKSGGYIFGFVVAAFVIGAICANSDSVARNFLAMLVGIVIIYALGVIQLMVVLKVDFGQAFGWGVFPFIWFDLVKAVIATSLVLRVRPFVVEPRAA